VADDGTSDGSAVPAVPDGDDDVEVVDAELVQEVRALREELRATIDVNSGTSGLTPSQIEAIDAASPELREVIIRRYDQAMDAEINTEIAMRQLTVKDQQDSVDILRFGMWVLVIVVCLLVGVAVFGILADQPVVAGAALGPIGVAAIGGVINMALRNRKSDEAED
jgi:uncharacterized protein (TIGR04222 family)